MIYIQISGEREVERVLTRVVDRGKRLRPVLLAIGENLSESTKQRFSTSTSPDGQAWAPNAPATIEAWMRHFSGAGFTSSAKKPLIGETRQLSMTIGYQVPDGNTLLVGSPMIYAASQQIGRDRIPARPFLGLSQSDTDSAIDTIFDYLIEV